MDIATRNALCVIVFVLATALLARYTELTSNRYPPGLVQAVQHAVHDLSKKNVRSIETNNPIIGLMYADTSLAEIALLRRLLRDDELQDITGINAGELFALCNQQQESATQALLTQLPSVASAHSVSEIARIYNRALMPQPPDATVVSSPESENITT
jgi:hypothetical protein